MTQPSSRSVRRKLWLGLIAVLAVGGVGVWLTQPDLLSPWLPSRPGAAGTVLDQAVQAADTGEDSGPPRSRAERVAELQRSLEHDRRYLAGLQEQLKDPDSELHRAESDFEKVDQELRQLKEEAQKLRTDGEGEQAADRDRAAADAQPHWQQAKERFDLALKENRAVQASVAALGKKIEQDQKALDRLLNGPAEPGPRPALVAADNSTPTAAAEPKAAPPAPAVLPGVPVSAETPSLVPAAGKPAAAPAAGDAPESPEVVKARQEARLKEAAAHQAEVRASSVNERLEELKTNIKLTRRLLETARKRAEEEQQTRTALDAQLQQLAAAGAPAADIQAVSQRSAASQRRLEAARAEVTTTTDRLHELQTELSELQADQIRALKEAEAKKRDAAEAEDRVSRLQNPFQPHNIVQWLFQHAPKLVLILVGMVVLQRMTRLFSSRIVQLMARGGMSKRGSHQDRENRAQTLVGVFSNTASLLIMAGGALMILQEVGIPIVPLMGGAAVLGLAVAFGAQNLIRDYFSGFMVLLEDQYGINDVIRIGETSGLVEHISLRMTVLRDMEGVVHFIPHGTLTTVSNLTHGWSRAVFDVAVAYKEDADRVMQVLLALGKEMQQDATFGPLILDEPQMLGVDNLADSAVVIKFFLKTRPLQQWPIKREMLRRIKRRFDELGIEIPFPHQTVYYRHDNPPASESLPLPSGTARAA